MMKHTTSTLRKNLFSCFLLFVFLLAAGTGRSQSYTDLVKWSFEAKKISDCEYELVLTAKMADNWHIYSQKVFSNGPLPTVITFNKNKNFQLVGKTSEPKGEIDKDWKDLENIEVPFFHHHAEFKQKIKVLAGSAFTITGTIDGQTCTIGGKCIQSIPPVQFEFAIPANATCGAAAVAVDTPKIVKPDTAGKDTGASVKSAGNDTAALAPFVFPDKPMDVKLETTCSGDSEVVESESSYWGVLIGGFLGGLLALLTPCVFPMIPLTVSFFTKRSKDRKTGIRNATIYAVSIIAIYVLLGMLITVTLGAQALNDMASNVYFNLIFFVVFVVFAISFFGAFEITLPSSFVSKVDSASDRGGLIGIFFMAFTLSLVSFSCTGPIIGTLLVEAASGKGYMGPAIGMFGFALALALPFALFAMFPGWLNSLPKSGGWLNSVKVVLGFVELALALKFLSNVDLAYHWGFLKREIFIAIWVVIGFLTGFYLLGKLKLSHDSDVTHISTPRLLFAFVFFSFSLYLVPGIFGAPTNFVSGYLPPSYYREWKTTKTDCPHDLSCFHDFDEAMTYARKNKKPLFVDFTGYSCVNCRKMEDYVWPQPKIFKHLSEDYVIVSLYVDDKEALPAAEHFTDEFGSPVKTYGKKWAYIQRKYFNQSAQPWYVLLDNGGKVLARPRGYTPEADEYNSFLEAGLCRYKLRMEAKEE
ncbi:MAG: proteiN-disulfide reductase [Bacteroidetes bacterium]|nr:MAG: proteiN-disulfide reductase [Bacteroidota bacterium]